jgi:hypothetical protein
LSNQALLTLKLKEGITSPAACPSGTLKIIFGGEDMKVRDLPKVAACAVLLTLAACGGGHSPSEPEAPPTVDSLTLVRVQPAADSVLRQGTQVTIRPHLRYAMARSSQGVITAFVLGGAGSGPAVIPTAGFPFALVAGNRGELDLPVTFTVPAGTTSLSLELFLDPDVADGNNNDGATSVSISYSAQP